MIISWQALCVSPDNLSFATSQPLLYFQLGKLRPRRLAELQQATRSEEVSVPFRQHDSRKGRDSGPAAGLASGEGFPYGAAEGTGGPTFQRWYAKDCKQAMENDHQDFRITP